jgi:hypothetical protein
VLRKLAMVAMTLSVILAMAVSCGKKEAQQEQMPADTTKMAAPADTAKPM